jgi:hypothetical protein
MDILTQRILAEGKNLGGGILKVDSFVNHQVDPVLIGRAYPTPSWRLSAIASRMRFPT